MELSIPRALFAILQLRQSAIVPLEVALSFACSAVGVLGCLVDAKSGNPGSPQVRRKGTGVGLIFNGLRFAESCDNENATKHAAPDPPSPPGNAAFSVAPLSWPFAISASPLEPLPSSTPPRSVIHMLLGPPPRNARLLHRLNGPRTPRPVLVAWLSVDLRFDAIPDSCSDAAIADFAQPSFFPAGRTYLRISTAKLHYKYLDWNCTRRVVIRVRAGGEYLVRRTNAIQRTLPSLNDEERDGRWP